MLRLDRDADSLVVSPAHGGAILGWTLNGRHLLRRPTPASVVAGQPGAMDCFSRVPWCPGALVQRYCPWAIHLAAKKRDRRTLLR